MRQCTIDHPWIESRHKPRDRTSLTLLLGSWRRDTRAYADLVGSASVDRPLQAGRRAHRCPRDRVRTCQFLSARRLPREEEKDWRVTSYGFGEPWRQGSARRICWPNSPHASRPIQRGPLHALANCRLSALFIVDRFPQALPLIPKRREPNFRFLSALLPLTFSLY